MRILKCSECNKTFTSKAGLDKHFQHHTGQYSHFCSICRKGFNNTYNYKEHMRGHEGKGYSCDYCGKMFQTKKYMKYHESEHTGVYRFTCEFCNKGFNVQSLFVKHTEVHKWFRIRTLERYTLYLLFKMRPGWFLSFFKGITSLWFKNLNKVHTKSFDQTVLLRDCSNQCFNWIVHLTFFTLVER